MASCENKYITLLDLSRQAKVITGETACFDGKIQVGLPFSGYPTGVDTGTTDSMFLTHLHLITTHYLVVILVLYGQTIYSPVTHQD
jgi:hypothetical protein